MSLGSVIQSIAEAKIRESQERGEFDNLPGKGAPLTIEDDSNVPEELRMAYTVLKNAGFVPPEIQERKEIANLADMLESCEDEQTKVRQMRKLETLIFKAKLHSGKNLQLDNESYFDKILDRIQVQRKKMKNG